MMWTTWRTDPGLGMFPSAACPDSCPSHEAIKQMNPDRPQGHRCKEYRHLPVLTRSAEPQTVFFCWIAFPSLRFWQAGAWKRVEERIGRLTAPGHQQSPTLGSVIGQFNFRMTASLLGKTATDFCRDGQLERPGDVICEGNRSISAAHAPSRSANLFCTVSQFHMSRFAMCIMPVFGVVSFAASGALRSAAVAS